MPNTKSPDITGLASTYAIGTRIDYHSHSAHQLVHAISGTMRVSTENATWFVPQGRALWIPAGEPHAINCIGEVKMRSAYFSKTYEPELNGVTLTSTSALMREILVRLAEHEDVPMKRQLAEVLLGEIGARKLAPFKVPIPNQPKIAFLIEQLQNFPDDKRSLSHWAKALGYSERSLIRHLRSETGLGFRELRRLIRVLVSMEKLAFNSSVTQTALEVGFETPSAFIHAFKVITGRTPRQLMREDR
ncbi:MAG: helix-turn-helix transcriptional regulator [Pseudomonadota bacterium]